MKVNTTDWLPLGDLPDEEEERFRVDDDGKANWCLKKIREIRREKQRQICNLEREIERYRRTIDEVGQRYDAKAARFEEMLGNYLLELDAKGLVKHTKSGGASYALPDGKLRYVPEKPAWEHDDAVLLHELKAAGLDELIKVAESPKWAEVKKRLSASDGGAEIETVDPETGEITRMPLNGVRQVTEPMKIQVEVSDNV